MADSPIKEPLVTKEASFDFVDQLDDEYSDNHRQSKTSKIRSFIDYVSNLYKGSKNHHNRRRLQLRQLFRIFPKRLCNLLIILFLIALIILIPIIAVNDHGKKLVADYIPYKNPKSISFKKDLLKTDISLALSFKNDWKNSPLNTDMLNKYLYFIGDLNDYFFNLKDTPALRKAIERDDICSQSSTSLKGSEDNGKNNIMVAKKNIKLLNSADTKSVAKLAELVEIREYIFKNYPNYKKHLTDEWEEKNLQDSEVLWRHWHKMEGEAIWLPSEKCYIMSSRVTYTDTPNRFFPTVTFAYLQAFDDNWNELKGKRVFYHDININTDDIAKSLAHIQEEVGIKDCTLGKYSSDPIAYDNCLTNNNRLKLQLDIRKEKFLNKFSISYPTILDFNLDNSLDIKDCGPKEVSIILKNGPHFQEPILHFTALEKVGNDKKKFKYLVFPHRKEDNYVKLTIPENTISIQNLDKRWSPFFHPNDLTSKSKLRKGYIHLITSNKPLEVLRCSLDSGICKKTYNSYNEWGDSKDSVQSLDILPGSQYVKLPSVVPTIKSMNLWVGFPLMLVKNCGCGEEFRRPSLTLLTEYKGSYNFELFSGVQDFNIPVTSWDLKADYCDAANSLRVTSILYWEVVSQNVIKGEFDDYMGIVVTEADYTTRVVVLRGVLNHIFRNYAYRDIDESFKAHQYTKEVIDKTLECFAQDMGNICKTYGFEHLMTGQQLANAITDQKTLVDKLKKEEETREKEEEERKKKEEEEKKKKEEEEKKKKEEEKKKKEEEEKKKKEEEKKKKD
ncbi:uncharacterized protein SCODWIG_01213 [Saccharomycodes ludwigii]|uniref:Beta-mannosyltransferase 1 n=1 Tax=Saccharomycodes ludwigii TaxID=36035 RepID=A0A376B4A8_9ASCO|nr:conserved putative beta-mannosyltransferase [Saccharomycodes ludwigii]KAH3899598.1 conserved putative beta-mannosyltransferase [Saccharomycodes ludwigii]SSD59452.1 uncharacterized protein SCODWIG_01213 [Saccharomycodes ludwigii]